MAELPIQAERLIDFKRDLVDKAHFQGEIKFDEVTRTLYSTDASIYQIEPMGVLFPKTAEDLGAAVETAARHHLPVLARGAGSSLAGQAIGNAVILDCSRYLNRCQEINFEEGWAMVEPGLVLASLNRMAGKKGFQFGPDPASAERATLGGCIANNSAGAHSIWYGMTADHVLALDVILADGSQANFDQVSLEGANYKMSASTSLEADIYRAAVEIRNTYSDEIRKRWPKTWRRSAGYNLNYLIPWSPSQPPLWRMAAETWAKPGQDFEFNYPPLPDGGMNLSSIIAGSEGTLAVLQRAKVRLVPLPAAATLIVIAYGSIPEACDDVPSLLEMQPSAVELIPRKLVELARSVPAYASQLNFVEHLSHGGTTPEALLAVEFAGQNRSSVESQAEKLLQIQKMRRPAYWAKSPEAQKQVWTVRKVGLGILMSRPGSLKPIGFIEDMGIPVENLGVFVREMDKILASFDTQAEIYAHASAGCLHIRPLIDLKTGQGRKYLRQIATEAVKLTLSLGGSTSAEHGDGIARSEWLGQTYGSEISAAFRKLKEAADPDCLLNPGKIVDPPGMDEYLRYGPGYQAAAWNPALNFYQRGETGLVDAVEQCNGAGVCRKSDGVMCPSFQVSQDEMHSTRGRANLLRAMLSGRFDNHAIAEKAVKEALDLCLACKGCKAECPSGVDMARLKYEFTNHYYQSGHSRLYRDYLFAYLDRFARLAKPFPGMANWLMQRKPIKAGLEKTLGLSQERPFPQFTQRTFSQMLAQWRRSRPKPISPPSEKVFFLVDAFGEFFHPEASLKAVQVLERIGVEVQILPGFGAGRTLLSKGFIEPARQRARQLVETLRKLDPSGQTAVVGVEPSEIYTLRDEYLDLLPGDSYVSNLALRTWSIEEYLIRPGVKGIPRSQNISRDPNLELPEVHLHGHCYQKTQPPADDGLPVGAQASAALLRSAGYRVILIDSGCCGMAGAFGYEAEHFEFSRKVAGLTLLPALQALGNSGTDVRVAASGVSCQAQISDLAGMNAVHPIIYFQMVCQKD